jgi:hypothetical protein
MVSAGSNPFYMEKEPTVKNFIKKIQVTNAPVSNITFGISMF